MPDTTMNCTVNVGSTPYFVGAMCINSRNVCFLFSSVQLAHKYFPFGKTFNPSVFT
mgnify:CR=1 FL=1